MSLDDALLRGKRGCFAAVAFDRPGALCCTLTPPCPSATAYCRARDIPRLLPLYPAIRSPFGEAAHRTLVFDLSRLVAAERRRGVCGDWTYDAGRHAALLETLALERTISAHLASQPGAVCHADAALTEHQSNAR